MYLGRPSSMARPRRIFERPRIPIPGRCRRAAPRPTPRAARKRLRSGRATLAARSAGRLPLPPALPVRRSALPVRGAEAAALPRRHGSSARLPRGRGEPPARSAAVGLARRLGLTTPRTPRAPRFRMGLPILPGAFEFDTSLTGNWLRHRSQRPGPTRPDRISEDPVIRGPRDGASEGVVRGPRDQQTGDQDRRAAAGQDRQECGRRPSRPEHDRADQGDQARDRDHRLRQLRHHPGVAHDPGKPGFGARRVLRP